MLDSRSAARLIPETRSPAENRFTRCVPTVALLNHVIHSYSIAIEHPKAASHRRNRAHRCRFSTCFPVGAQSSPPGRGLLPGARSSRPRLHSSMRGVPSGVRSSRFPLSHCPLPIALMSCSPPLPPVQVVSATIPGTPRTACTAPASHPPTQRSAMPRCWPSRKRTP
jgi:hypothetical protein